MASPPPQTRLFFYREPPHYGPLFEVFLDPLFSWQLVVQPPVLSAYLAFLMFFLSRLLFLEKSIVLFFPPFGWPPGPSTEAFQDPPKSHEFGECQCIYLFSCVFGLFTFFCYFFVFFAFPPHWLACRGRPLPSQASPFDAPWAPSGRQLS